MIPVQVERCPENRVADFEVVPTVSQVKGKSTNEEEVHEDGNTPEIGLVGVRNTHPDLWSHVSWTTVGRVGGLLSRLILVVTFNQLPHAAFESGREFFESGKGRREVKVSRHTIVAEDNVPICIEEDIVWLDIAVDNLPFVKLLQGYDQLNNDQPNLSWGDVQTLINGLVENPGPKRLTAAYGRSSKGRKVATFNEVHQEIIIRCILPATNKATQPVGSSCLKQCFALSPDGVGVTGKFRDDFECVTPRFKSLCRPGGQVERYIGYLEDVAKRTRSDITNGH